MVTRPQHAITIEDPEEVCQCVLQCLSLAEVTPKQKGKRVSAKHRFVTYTKKVAEARAERQREENAAALAQAQQILQSRASLGLTRPPEISGFNGTNILRCAEEYTIQELRALASQNGIPTSGDAQTMCVRLLSKGHLQ